MVFALITAWLAYKRAKATQRSGIVWAVIGAAVFIGTQLLVSLGCGIALGLGVELLGWSETVYDNWTMPITIIAIAASFATSWLLLRYLDKIPQAGTGDVPPPPPNFNPPG